MKPMKQGTALAASIACDKLVVGKCRILKALHDFCVQREISYFACDILARAAQSRVAMTQEECFASWNVAMLRPDYRRFCKVAEESGLRTKDTRKGIVELTLPDSGDAVICLVVYDALPADLAANARFRQEMERLNDQLDRGEVDYETVCAYATSFAEDPAAVMVAPLVGAVGTQFNRALVLPVKNRKFRDILVCVPDDCTIFMNNLPQTLAQQKLLVLRVLDEICQQKGLRYFAINKLDLSSRMYGDLLPNFDASAMEVGMLRADHEALTAAVEEDNRLVAFDTNDQGWQDGVLRLTLREFAQMSERPEQLVSVIPYDFLPQCEKQRKDFLAEMKHLNDRYAAAVKADRSRSPQERQAPGLYRQLREKAASCAEQQDGMRRICRVQCGQSKILPYHFVYPVVRSAMADFEIDCAQNPYIWAKSTNINYNDCANARKAEILKRLTQLCEEQGITSFAIANLLVGMVTYEDYIPNNPTANWDLALLRDEYEKLLTVLREKASDYGLVLTEFRDEARRFPKATKTVTLEEMTWPEGEIRLVPFDKMPESYDTQYAFLRKLRKRNALFKALSEYEMTGESKLSAKDRRKAYKKYGCDPLNALYAEIDQLSQFYNEDEDIHQYGRMAFEKSKFITEELLWPLEKGFVRGVAVNRPRDYSPWTPVIDEALRFQTESIQKADFLLIDKVDEICRKLNIGYFICGGSMLGYARNGGFIPWDDDIDVAMLRRDYDRFIAEAEPFLDDRFFLQTRQKDPHIPYLFTKLRLNNTEYVTEYNENRAFHKGICLDIFPFDYIPNGAGNQEKFKKEVIKLSKAHNRIVNNQMPEPIDPFKPRNLREWYYKFYGRLKRFYFRSHSLKKSQQAYLDKATSLNDKAEELGLTTVASFVPSYTYIKLDDLLPYQDVLFDGHRVKVPRRPDVFLTMQYGDYLQLPPKHNRVAHRLLRWSVDVKADEQKRLAAETDNR